MDRGLVELVRLVLDDDWTVERASGTLHDRVGDPAVVVEMAARVNGALADRASQIHDRAVATLRHSLSGWCVEHPGDTAVPMTSTVVPSVALPSAVVSSRG